MNRMRLKLRRNLKRFPYARGDEPLTHIYSPGQHSFPYARGDEPAARRRWRKAETFSLRT